MRVVESEQPRTVRRMQRECVRQAVWSRLGRFNALDLKLEPISLLEMMDAPIEGQEKFEPMFVCCHIIT
jgi:hypothetical protein